MLVLPKEEGDVDIPAEPDNLASLILLNVRVDLAGCAKIDAEEERRPAWTRIDCRSQKIGDQELPTHTALVR
ncbi:hypothetical protein [Brachybacterium aquaticum]|uniref:Uncharacterized protein n=1 Tax=Brachybacterium aquaticum TaxID=1432564 RepID=A0A841ABH1_9MICO|nr:hypothetical protein [Brachybacterium aquaticum]MBB5830544.1 hypothetical protein [Brachybacterium aquaticum]